MCRGLRERLLAHDEERSDYLKSDCTHMNTKTAMKTTEKDTEIQKTQDFQTRRRNDRAIANPSMTSRDVMYLEEILSSQPLTTLSRSLDTQRREKSKINCECARLHDVTEK